jgi:hypothetical protein
VAEELTAGHPEEIEDSPVAVGCIEPAGCEEAAEDDGDSSKQQNCRFILCGPSPNYPSRVTGGSAKRSTDTFQGNGDPSGLHSWRLPPISPERLAELRGKRMIEILDSSRQRAAVAPTGLPSLENN